MVRRGTLLFVLLATACSGGTEPVNVFGSYQLHSVNGTDAPVTLPEIPTRIVDGSLTLGSDGRFTLGLAYDDPPYGSGADAEMHWDGTFTQTGTGIALTGLFSTLPGQPVETIHGSVTGPTVTLELDLELNGDAETFVFRR